MSTALWESIVYPPFFINNPPSLPFSRHSPLPFAHKLPFLLRSVSPHSPALSFLVIPAFCCPLATLLFQGFILPFLALSLLSVVPFLDNGGILLPWLQGGREGDRQAGSEGQPVTDSPVWGARLAWPFVPLPRKMEGTQGGGAAGRRRGEGEGQRGCHSCAEVSGTLDFKQLSAGGGGGGRVVCGPSLQSNISPYRFISIGLEVTKHVVLPVHVLLVSDSSALRRPRFLMHSQLCTSVSAHSCTEFIPQQRVQLSIATCAVMRLTTRVARPSYPVNQILSAFLFPRTLKESRPAPKHVLAPPLSLSPSCK